MLEKRFYWAALFRFRCVQRFPSDILGHSWNRLSAQALTPGVDWETVWAGSAWGLWAVFSGNRFWGGGGGGVSSIAWETSSVTSRVAFLNSLMPWPSPFANSGSFLAPNKIRIKARMRIISPPPKLKMPNIIFMLEKTMHQSN